MNHRILFCLGALGIAGAASAADFVDGEILVRFRPNYTIANELGVANFGGVIVEELRAIGVSRVQLPLGASVPAAVEYFRGLPNVEFAEPNYIGRIAFTPNDPSFGSQYGPQKINCPTAWDLTQGNAGVVIAIIDTGIDAGHPDLAGKLVPGYDFANNDSNPFDDNGHGTHCAGIAAVSTNNGIGIAGVGFNCSLMGVKVLNASGSGSFSAIANGITWATDNGADVINLSLGGSSGSSTLESAVNYANSRNVVVIAAAGNSNTSSVFYPAGYPVCIAVGSTDQNDNKSSFSNFGSWVDVAAPGSSILSTYPGNRYATLSGTSMAAPHVAGQAGLLFAYLGLSTPNSTIRARIENNTVNVGTWVARGRVNVRASLDNSGGGGGGGGTASYAPSGVQVFVGSVFGGNAGSLAASDDVRFDLRSGASGSNRVVDYDAIVTGVSRGAGVSQIQFTVENQMTISGGLQVYLYNYGAARYDLIATQSVGTGDTSSTYTVTANAGNYVSGSGEMRVGFYRSRSGTTNYNLRSDFVRVTVTTL
jgi:thermitase